MIVLAVTWVAKETHEKDVADVFRQLESESRKEPGCLMYIVHRLQTDSRHFFVYEQYRDDAAMQQHRNSAHFQKLAVGELPRVADRIRGELFEPLTA